MRLLATSNNCKNLDPVLQWLEVHGQRGCKLKFQATFGLDKGPLLVRSNAEKAIGLLKEHFLYYPVVPPEFASITQTIIDIYYVGSLKRWGGIRPSAAEEGEKRLSVLKSDRAQNGQFLHFMLDGAEWVWRPLDMLFTFGHRRTEPIRILIGDPISDGAGKTKYKLKAPRVDGTELIDSLPCDFSETIDLVKLLYLRRHGLFCIHAASLAHRNTGIILVGKSGSGKTTAALALARSGFAILSDELTVIDIQNGSPRMGGILVPPRIGGHTFCDLERLEIKLVAEATSNKRKVFLPKSYVIGGLHKYVEPHAIFFLGGVGDKTGSYRVNPIAPREAFVSLMNQVLDPTNASRKELQAEALISLVESCRSYHLTLGKDLGSLPDIIRGCLENE
jgi:hypothetical protein